MAAELESDYSPWKTKSCCKKWCQLDRIIVVVVIMSLWSLPAIPFISYTVIRNRNSNITMEESLSADPCSDSVLYNGSVCHDALMQHILDCDQNSSPSSKIRVVNKNVNAVEDLVREMASTISEDCMDDMTSFYCLYLLEGICTDGGAQILPTSEDCLKIQTCQELRGILPWQGVGEVDCASFPIYISDCTNKEDMFMPHNVTEPNLLQTNSCSLNCREDFFCDNSTNTCVPECPGFKFYSPTATVVSDVIVIIFSWLGFLAGITVLIISIIRRKTVLTFPSVLAVYETLTLMIKDVIQIITYLDREALYCSSPNLLETLANIPPYCVLSGLVLAVYIPMQFNIWWVAHMLVLYLGVRFPLKFITPSAKKKLRVFHIVVVIVGLLVPTIPVIAIIVGSMFQDQAEYAKLGIRYGTPPPTLCAVASVDFGFFFVVLPNIILAVTGSTLLVLLIWTVHKKFGIVKTVTSRASSPLSTTEIKLLLVIMYFITIEILFLSFSTQSIGNLNPLLEHFKCEQPGVDPENPCSRAGFENDLGQYIFAFYYSSLLIIPAVCLVFVVDFSMIINKIKHMCCKKNCCSKSH